MKILFLSQVLPYPLDAGPKVRAYYTLRHLAERHTVTLAALVRESDTAEARAHVAAMVDQLVVLPLPRAPWRDALAFGRSLALGLPFLVTRDQVPAMHRMIADLARTNTFDFVHADQLWMAPYALTAQAAAGENRPTTVLDQHNAVYRIPQRMAATTQNPLMRMALKREARLMARYEARLCRAIDQVVMVTDEDRAALLQLYRTRPPNIAAVIPICVPMNGSAPEAATRSGASVLFLGGMHWPPNAEGVNWFVREAWPTVRAKMPQAEFWAVGKRPPPDLVRADAAQRQGLHATGYAPDLEPHWHRASVFVVPLRSGGGMRVKILEAWRRGVPVVSTSVGAEGLRCEDGINVLLADNPQDLAQAILRVLADQTLARRLADAGQATVRQHYDWQKTYTAWDAIYTSR